MNYQFISRQLTLDNLSRSNQGHMPYNRLHLVNGASYQIFHETHVVNHICSFCLHLTLGSIERSNQDHWVLIWLCIIDN